jgi:hypothetical protein
MQYLSEAPLKRALLRHTGERIWSPSTEPHADGRSSRGSFKTLILTTPVPCSLWHDTFPLGAGRPETSDPAWVEVTLYRVSPPHLLPPATWPRVRIASMCRGTPIRAPPPHLLPSPHNPKVQTRGWSYGKQHSQYRDKLQAGRPGGSLIPLFNEYSPPPPRG